MGLSKWKKNTRRLRSTVISIAWKMLSALVMLHCLLCCLQDDINRDVVTDRFSATKWCWKQHVSPSKLKLGCSTIARRAEGESSRYLSVNARRSEEGEDSYLSMTAGRAEDESIYLCWFKELPFGIFLSKKMKHKQWRILVKCNIEKISRQIISTCKNYR